VVGSFGPDLGLERHFRTFEALTPKAESVSLYFVASSQKN
jgi:hypothetical protein